MYIMGMFKNNPNKRSAIGCAIGFFSQSFLVTILSLFYSRFIDQFSWQRSYISMIILAGALSQITIDIFSGLLIKKFGFKFFGIIAPIVSFTGILLATLAPLTKNSATVFCLFILASILISLGCGIFEIIVNSLVLNMPIDSNDKLLAFVHSTYSFGNVSIVVIISILIKLVGIENWQFIMIGTTLLPIIFTIFFFSISNPPANGEKQDIKSDLKILKSKYFILANITLLFGGAGEILLVFWLSIFAEKGLGFTKTKGDMIILVPYLIAIVIVRLLYSKYSKKENLIYYLMASSFLCIINGILVVAIPSRITAIIGCIGFGFSVSILWPGIFNLIGRHYPKSSAFIFSILCLVGDAALAFSSIPGIIADSVLKIDNLNNFAIKFNLTQEQLAYKIAISPVIIAFLITFIMHIVLHKIDKKVKIKLQ